MADIGIQVVTNIEGLDELEEALVNGSKKTAKKFLRGVEMKAATILVKSAKAYAPYETGQGEASIHKQTVVDTQEGSMTVRVGPSSIGFYLMFQEFGAPDANITALHWLENSAVAVQDEVLETYMSELGDSLDEMKG